MRRPADQLQRAVERNEYGEAAHLIEAVQQLAGHFQSFVAIPKVAELSGRVATLQRAVQVPSRADDLTERRLGCSDKSHLQAPWSRTAVPPSGGTTASLVIARELPPWRLLVDAAPAARV